MDYLEWTIKWFAQNGSAKEQEMRQHLDDNYFDLGYVDSFGFIMLIGAAEQEFHISFQNDQFQDRSFSTIRGFAECLARGADAGV